MWWHSWARGWAASLPMTVGMLTLWGLLIWAAAWVLRGGTTRPQGLRMDPEQMLAARFAAGEIGEAEHHDRLSILRSARQDDPTRTGGHR